ncbi:hypothetical protein A3A64_02885 [Candidatus Gottesmanbacteria bacterium RIFCSPLOWO2_01_FULL_48_11]|uniref:Uncharacterized protein n=1 Tax=Candidatus Gottesmanbacteria bacterium RIFCSPLOWO2_01_FULL_48_11 TaxID=1798395 RepID=A0A1F6AS97_9BACT|nr:MAG: hypothetical protein A3A64_02885 [Candidatus Gottesmanbacteria bacterium RIFCSPLOWO2_01_FULL_48_11]
MILFLLFAELATLYFLSRWLTKKLYLLFLLLFRVRSVAISAVTLLLFPGTVIHELSHLFTAEILGVRTGKLTLAPEDIRSDNIKAGSVAIAKTDPLRRAAIGLSPIFTGIFSLAALSWWLPSLWQLTLLDAQNGVLFSHVSLYALLFTLYSLFSISNSMFSSREDLSGFWPLAITLGLFTGAAYAIGLRVGLEGKVLEVATTILSSLVQSLGLVLAVNTILLLVSSALIATVRRITA